MTFDNSKIVISLKNLEVAEEANISELGISYKQKVSYLTKKYLSVLNRQFLNMRFFHDVKQFDFHQVDLQKDYRKSLAPVV